jgi:hypothetical protein
MVREIAICGLALVLSGCRCPSGDRPDAVVRPESGLAPPYDWTFIFVAPYDNDLDRFARHVETQVRTGAASEGVAATLLIDDLGSGGLKRLAVSSSGTEERVLETEDSTDLTVLERHLEWSAETFPARHYALILLDHGGRLDELCRDLQPLRADNTEARWMTARGAAEVIGRWHRNMAPGGLDLLFLQQCGRASLEIMYTFRDTATFVMASQSDFDGPNTYYARTLQRASEGAFTDGEQLGRFIMNEDRHTTSLAIFRGSAIAELPARLDALAAVLTSRASEAPLLLPEHQSPCFEYGGETHHDLLGYLGTLARLNGLDDSPAWRSFEGWVRDELVVAHRVRMASRRPLDPTWSGASMFLPRTPRALETYRELPLYRDSRWDELLTALIEHPPAP